MFLHTHLSLFPMLHSARPRKSPVARADSYTPGAPDNYAGLSISLSVRFFPLSFILKHEKNDVLRGSKAIFIDMHVIIYKHVRGYRNL